MIVEEVEADNEIEAIQIAKERVDYYSGSDFDWMVEETEEEEIIKMEKYYLYDIQNDERVFETDDETYWILAGCIFNEEMLETAASLGLYSRYTSDEVDAIQYLSQKIRELKAPEERIYKIIKIEVD